MLVFRNINGTDVAVETSMPSRILFKREDIEKLGVNPSNMDIKQIEKALKKDSQIVPFDLVWELTNRCNLNCAFCYIHNVKCGRDITFEEAKPVIDELAKKGLIHVTLTGGECTLNRDFLKIYRYFKEKGVIVDVYTNGIFLSEEVYTTFKELPPNSVQITIYNTRENEIRPYETIFWLKEMGINTLAKFTVTTETVKHFDFVKNWCEKNDIDFQFDTDIFDPENPFEVSKYQVDEDTKITLDKIKYKGIEINHNQTKIECLSCGAGNVSIHINANFELAFCSKSSERYPLDKMCFDDAYGEMVRKILAIKGKEFKNCTGCFAKPLCRMCYLKVDKTMNQNGNMCFSVSTEHCKRTKEYYLKVTKE